MRFSLQNTELDKKTYRIAYGNCERSYHILNERGVYGDRMAACINDSITKWNFTQTKILKCLLFPLIFQLYFIKEIGNLVPHWKELENLPKESAIAAYFMHRSCVFQAESLFLLLASCTCHKGINTNIYFCQLLLLSVEIRQRERQDWDFTYCGRHTQTAIKGRQHGLLSIFIRNMKTRQ